MQNPQDLESLLPNLDKIYGLGDFQCLSDRSYASAIRIISEKPESLHKLEIKMRSIDPKSMLIYGIGVGSDEPFGKPTRSLFYTESIHKNNRVECIPLYNIGSFTLLDKSIHSPDYKMSTKKLLEYLETWKKQSNPMTSEEWEKFREERTRIKFS